MKTGMNKKTTKTNKSLLKGVYKLNPTEQIFKQGSAAARKAVTESVPGYKKIKPVKPKTVKVKKGK